MMGGIAVLILVLVVLAATGLLRSPSRPEVGGAQPSARQLERLEEALAALESRVDSLQDQQRFLERLLAERPAPDALASGGGGQGAEEQTGDGGSDPAARSVLFETGPGEEER